MTMDLLEKDKIDSLQCITTLPVRYTVEDESSDVHVRECTAELEHQLNEISSTDDENQNYLVKSANSDFDFSTSHPSESESDFCERTNNNRTINNNNYVTAEELKSNLLRSETNGHISTPRYSIPNGTSSFRLTIPSIQEAKESGESDCGSSSSVSSRSKTFPEKQHQVIKNNLTVKNNLSVKNMSRAERRSSFAGVPRERRSSLTAKDQKHTPRRRFSISVSSSDDESSSSGSGSEEQIKIERYMQSRQGRRHSMATTSNELVQAMSLLMGKRGSSKANNLIPLLASALVNLANSADNGLDPEQDCPKQQRHSAPDAPIITVSEDGYVCKSCKCARPKSPVDLLTRPHRPHSPDSDGSSSNDTSGHSDRSLKHLKHLSPEIDVIRILTTRSPGVSEDEDTDSDGQKKRTQRRKSRSNRKSSSPVPQISKSNRRNGLSHLTPSSLKSQSRRSSFSSVPSTASSRSQSRRSSISSLSTTPPPSKLQSRRSSLNLQTSGQTGVVPPEELRKRLENSIKTPSENAKSLKNRHKNKLSIADSPVKDSLGVPGAIPENNLDVCDGTPRKLLATFPGRMNRRASMCVPSTETHHHPAANPPSSLEEEELIKRRATQRGRRRSSWAGSMSMSSSAPASTLAQQLRAASPMTLLRESKYYGDDHDLADNKKYQDPYFLTIHFITDPKRSRKLKKLLKPLIDSIVPKLKLFNYVERSEKMPKKPELCKEERLMTVPASGVVLFINEGFGMERIMEAQKYLSEKSEWTVHHSEKVGSNAVPYPTNNQDFYAHHSEMPLWAVRQVHFGRDRLRFQIFVSNENWQDTIDFYSTVLARNFQYQKDDFCYFLVFASRELNLEVQLAFKKLPVGFKPRLLDSTILQFKVETIEGLVPLLPNVCSPISDRRYQTMDPDGNKILLFKISSDDITAGTYSAPSTASTMSTISSDCTTEVSDSEAAGTPSPRVESRSDSPKLPEFVNHISDIVEVDDNVESAV